AAGLGGSTALGMAGAGRRDAGVSSTPTLGPAPLEVGAEPSPAPLVPVALVTAVGVRAPTAAAGTTVDLSGSPTAAPPAMGVPTRIQAPAIGVDAPVQVLGHNQDGSRQVPARDDTV